MVRLISFGVDNRLIAKTFRSYFASKGISINFIVVSGLDSNKIKKEFVKIINNNGIIVCNGIVQSFNNTRNFSFKIKNSQRSYIWKEASHSFVIVGYNLDKNTFRIPDNYGNINRPYTPGFYDIDFEQLLYEITIINRDFLDYTIVLSKASRHLMQAK